jgi:hypothetical protein
VRLISVISGAIAVHRARSAVLVSRGCAGAGVVVLGAGAGIAAGVGRMRAITATTSAAAARTAAINAVQENRARGGAGCCGGGLPVSGSTAAEHPARHPVVDSFTQRKTSHRQVQHRLRHHPAAEHLDMTPRTLERMITAGLADRVCRLAPGGGEADSDAPAPSVAFPQDTGLRDHTGLVPFVAPC